jgi:hypothetical protein
MGLQEGRLAKAGLGRICCDPERFGRTVWPGTRALYVAPVTLSVPVAKGVHAWSVTFRAAIAEASHSEASTRLTFLAAEPLEHRFTVTVEEADTQDRIANAQVQGDYRSAAEEGGQASLDISKGHYELDVRTVGYETHSETVDVTEDVAIQIEVLSAPEKNPDDQQVWI